jgi:adenylate kinase family enzyme
MNTKTQTTGKIKTKQLFFFTGLPLSGKSHLTKILALDIPNSLRISTGDIARSLIKTDLQQKEMESKDLFPGELELRAELKRQIDDSPATCILVDGFPRFGEQVTYLADNFFDLFPVIIDVCAGDLQTLAQRARNRGRDSRDANDVEFIKRLNLAMCNHNDVDIVVRRRLLPAYTIMSSGSEQVAINHFRKIAKL